MVEKISQQAKERLASTKTALGEAGLKRKADELAAAQKENDRPIPDNMITDFPISDVSQGVFARKILSTYVIYQLGFQDRLDSRGEVRIIAYLTCWRLTDQQPRTKQCREPGRLLWECFATGPSPC